MPAAQKGGALFQGDAAGLLRKRKIEPGRRAVPIHRFARRQQDMRAAHVELCPDIASERLPVVRPASDKPVLPDGAVVIKKIEHAQARLCRRRDHRRMHGAADGKLRLVRTHCNGERAGICLLYTSSSGIENIKQALLQTNMSPSTLDVYKRQVWKSF